VDGNKRKTIEGWIDKASNHLDTAKEHLKSLYRISDSIQAAPVCIELSVKAILAMLDVEYSRNHGWDRKQLSELAKQIAERDLLNRLKAEHLEYTVPLPRLLFRANFGSQFYLEAKYGFEAEHLAPAQELFEKGDAELAATHADTCLQAARTLLYLPEDKRVGLTGR
jgi:HEPN domain-containing protein